MAPKDLFSGHCREYACYRPHYPRQLFELLAHRAPATELALDLATGSGQSAFALSGHFERVIGVDLSRHQLRHSRKAPNLDYLMALGESLPLRRQSVDLVTIAQALHWLNLEFVGREVARVLKPGGVLAIWSYGNCSVGGDVDEVVHRLYEEVLGSYWTPERRWVEQGYAGLTLPLAGETPRLMALRHNWRLTQFIGYLQTWSALQRYLHQHHQGTLDPLWQDLAQAWGDPARRRAIHWPLTLRLFLNS
ncbi:class I SAM-dependent methyltransferase [Ferrimonas sediminicola]|uniref:Class I SAM-dependent methyltransferase n=1 Tax=Ferrimonas sediminicola TaxID=2569538 RepID=A0A4U1BEE8_9GAMM|nr:class I SAM-dependent methyltransferase [Ferrimonas sediminicola]TKB49416.1 class I SAM-dependent methyltransferase [Ferrimonas sediminicola]